MCIAPGQSVVVKMELEQNAIGVRKNANAQNQKKPASRATDIAKHALSMIGVRNKGRLDKNWGPFHFMVYFIASQSFLSAG